MKTIAIIINGTRLPYHVIHYAIARARNESAGILAIFLKGKREAPKGYIFPSDISSTDNSFFANQAESEDENLITDNMNVVKTMVEHENISYQSVLKTNASIDEIVELTSAANLIVIDQDFDEKTLLADEKISLNALTQSSMIPVDVIEDY